MEETLNVQTQENGQQGKTRANSLDLLSPRVLLHLEGVIVLLASLVLYTLHGGNWWLFGLLLFTPDLSALGYLAGSRLGARCYNLVHTYLLPGVLAAYGLLGGRELAFLLALIWFAHIGLDRALGFGLKYMTEFKDTHLAHV